MYTKCKCRITLKGIHDDIVQFLTQKRKTECFNNISKIFWVVVYFFVEIFCELEIVHEQV